MDKKALIILIIAGVFITGAFFYTNKNKCKSTAQNNQVAKENILPSQEVGERMINYINKNLLEEGLTASLMDVSEQGCLYKFHLKIADQEYESYVTKDGNLLFTGGIDLETFANTSSTIGNFSVNKNEVCKDNEKPIIYFFGSKNCPHCAWEHPVVEKVIKKFEGYISFHNNMDLEQDKEIFRKFSTGGIPTLVLGCKYYRVGSGEQMGEGEESRVLTALICSLTKENPADVCNSVKDLINQIGQ